jgi:hypothetical protein
MGTPSRGAHDIQHARVSGAALGEYFPHLNCAHDLQPASRMQ